MTDYIKLIEYGRDSVDDYISEIEKQLAKQYKDAYQYAKSQLADLYAKMGSNISLPEAQKYNRYNNMMKSIDEEYKKITGKSLKATEKTSTASVKGAYDSNWFAFEVMEDSRLAFGNLPVDAIRASVYSEYSGANIIKRYGTLYQSSVDKVAQSITRGIATGQGYAKTASDVKDIFGTSYSDTLRIIRTESTRAWDEGARKSYERAEELGIKGVKTWLATNSARTRDSHARLNGKEADEKGLFHMGGLSSVGPGHWGNASMDINCRCTTYYKLEDAEGAPDWTYNQWKNNFYKWQEFPHKMSNRRVSDK